MVVAARERKMTSTDPGAASVVDKRDEAGEPLPSMTPAEKTAAVTRVRYFERLVFDDAGRLRRRLDTARVEELVREINRLRAGLGWLQVDGSELPGQRSVGAH
jgi:hypothetical protein